jgi:hypothetical protein
MAATLVWRCLLQLHLQLWLLLLLRLRLRLLRLMHPFLVGD